MVQTQSCTIGVDRPSHHGNGWLQNFFALVPLALILGEVTEDLAVRFGDTAGGLLNATFGNITELILSVAALTKGLNVVVAMSLIGSVLSNLLLVLGMSLPLLYFGNFTMHESCVRVISASLSVAPFCLFHHACATCHGMSFQIALWSNKTGVL